MLLLYSFSFFLLLFISRPVQGQGFSCNNVVNGEVTIASSSVTTTTGCQFSDSARDKYVYLSVPAMVQNALAESKTEVAISITDTSFSDIGLKFEGYSGNVPVVTVPLKVSITTTTMTNTQGSPCLLLVDKLPPKSVFTIKGNTLSARNVEAVSSNNLTLSGQTQITLEQNTMSIVNLYKESLGVWGDNSLWMTGQSTLKWVKNTMSTDIDGEGMLPDGSRIVKRSNHILYQTSSPKPVLITEHSLILWIDNKLTTTAPEYASMWYPFLKGTTVRVTNYGNVTWVGNTMKVETTTTGGFPYIWYTDSAEISDKGSVSFRSNKINVKSRNFIRIWYQRIVMTVSGEGSFVAWEWNDITTYCGGGDNSIWFQGTPDSYERDPATHTTISDKGHIRWAHNDITMVGGIDRIVWRQHSNKDSSMTMSSGGTVHWINNTISSSGIYSETKLWFQTNSMTISMSGGSTVAWWNNTLDFKNKVEKTNCIACSEAATFTISSGSTIAFENNTLDVSTKRSDPVDLALFQGPFSMSDTFVKINRNIFTFSDILRLARLWDINSQTATDSSISLCRNRYNMYYMKLYAGYVAPPSLVPFIEPNCPFTDTSTVTYTPTAQDTATATDALSLSHSVSLSAVPTNSHTPPNTPSSSLSDTFTVGATSSRTHLLLSATSTPPGTQSPTSSVTLTASSTRDVPHTATKTLLIPPLTGSPTLPLPVTPSATHSLKGTHSGTLRTTASKTRPRAASPTVTTTEAPTTVVVPTTTNKKVNDSAARAEVPREADGNRSGPCYLYLCIIIPIIIGGLLLCCCLLIICLCCCCRGGYKHELLDDVEPCVVHYNFEREANGQAPPNTCVLSVPPSDDNGFSDPFPQPKLQQEGTAEAMPEDDNAENPFQIPKQSAYEETVDVD